MPAPKKSVAGKIAKEIAKKTATKKALKAAAKKAPLKPPISHVNTNIKENKRAMEIALLKAMLPKGQSEMLRRVSEMEAEMINTVKINTNPIKNKSLENVPKGVSNRFDATNKRLAAEAAKKKKK